MGKLTITFILLCSLILNAYSGIYYSRTTSNEWSLSSGGANCFCTPTAADEVVISHNWANVAFYPLTNTANLAFGNFLTVNPIKVTVKNGGVIYQQGILPTGMILIVEAGGKWAYNGSLTFGSGLFNIASISNSGSVLVNGSYDNRMSINNTGEFCKNGSFLNDITIPASLNGIKDANMNSYFNNTNYGNASCYQPVILPVQLLFFDYSLTADGIIYQWSTATEINNDYFEILGSNDLNDWKSIGTIDGAGDNYSELDYSFTSQSNNYLYAKLKQVDYDGASSYSKVIIIKNDELSIEYQADNKITVSNHYKNNLVYHLYNVNGVLLYSGILDKGVHTINFNEITDYKGLAVFNIATIIEKYLIH